jgi:branched-chain amino acid transport system substrate-binding protein
MGWRRGAVALALCAFATSVQAQEVRLPVLVPLTGFVALEGTSQRNGALLAASQLREVMLKPEVLDTAATPEAAVNAWARAVGTPPPVAWRRASRRHSAHAPPLPWRRWGRIGRTAARPFR